MPYSKKMPLEIYKQTWFYLEDESKTFSRETLLDDYWRDTWAFLVEENISPILMGEWGGWVDDEHDKTGENRHWLQEIRDYMIDKHIHHTFWCFNENSSDTGGLVYDNFQKWDDIKYEFIKPALWQTEDGKFISLDHKIPMGRAGNGISLGEYYSGNPGSQSTTQTTAAPDGTTTTSVTTGTTTSSTKDTTATSKETTTTTATTSKSETTTTSTSSIDSNGDTLYGDANCDKEVSVADAVLIMQKIANPSKYDVNGTDEKHITAQGIVNSDCFNNGDGVTNKDALAIQQYKLGLIKELPAK